MRADIHDVPPPAHSCWLKTTLWSARDLIVRLVADHRLPAIYPLREYVTSGGLLRALSGAPRALSDRLVHGAHSALLS
jgi:hypothetical protein